MTRGVLTSLKTGRERMKENIPDRNTIQFGREQDLEIVEALNC